MDIHAEIQQAITNCAMQTGANPTRLYLGRSQTDRLMKWAYENQYISEPEMTEKEGQHRPEVMGLLVYEVNDDDHCVAV